MLDRNERLWSLGARLRETTPFGSDLHLSDIAPAGLALDNAGTLWIASERADFVLALSESRAVRHGGCGGVTAARFRRAAALAPDRSGNIFVADTANHCIRRIEATGKIATIAGNGTPGNRDGPGRDARFSRPFGIAVDSAGTVYVADTSNHRICRIAPDSTVTTLAGGTGSEGYADGTARSATFSFPGALTIGDDGALLVADEGNESVRLIHGGRVSTVAGWDTRIGRTGGRFRASIDPKAIAFDRGTGSAFVVDARGGRVLRFGPDGEVQAVTETLALEDSCTDSDRGPIDSPLGQPWGVAARSDGAVLVTDRGRGRVLRVRPDGQLMVWADNRRRDPTAPEVTAGLAREAAGLAAPLGIAVDASGDAYVADGGNNQVKRLSSSGTVETISEFAFSATKAGGGVWGLTAGLALSRRGDVFVGVISQAWPREAGHIFQGLTSGQFAKTPITSGENLALTPAGLAVGPDGVLFVADTYGCAIRAVAPSGRVTTVAGGVTRCGFGDGATEDARFKYPTGLAISPDGSIYVADSHNHRIRKITNNRRVITVAGNGVQGGTDGPGPEATLDLPTGVAYLPDGSLAIVEFGGRRLRRLSPDGQVDTWVAPAGRPRQDIRNGAPAR